VNGEGQEGKWTERKKESRPAPDADDTIHRLLDDEADAPERHKMVAALMHFDMRQWRDEDLGWITPKMGNIKRRLDRLSNFLQKRGGFVDTLSTLSRTHFIGSVKLPPLGKSDHELVILERARLCFQGTFQCARFDCSFCAPCRSAAACTMLGSWLMRL
jgi:hypothetical protein